MNKEVKVRNCVLGSGLPKIVVPICRKTKEEILKDAERIALSGADLLEFRADAYSCGGENVSYAELMRDLRAKAGDIPILFTFRSAAEGGMRDVTPEMYRDIAADAVASGLADLIDIEQESPFAAELVRLAKSRSLPVVMSFHDFRKTPDVQALTERLRRMEQSGADVAKIACMPGDDRDAVRVLGASAMTSEMLGIPHVLISMGGPGLISRTSAEVFGSAFTFGCLPGGESAPGQMEASALRKELDRIHGIRRNGPHIFLIGFMGCGKSTAARNLRDMGGYELIEMDEQIEREQNRSISSIFAKEGEAAFRDMESSLLAGLYDRPPAVISCGGGAVLRPENTAMMKRMGKIVLLSAEPETVFERVRHSGGKRPLLKNRMSPEGIASLMEERRKVYEDAADLTVRTDGKSRRDTAGEILRAVKELVP